MAGNLSMRASDADRDRVATVLRENLAVGRLTTDEFSERLDKALAARTVGELETLTTDLPSTQRPGQRADAALDRAEEHPPSTRRESHPVRRTAWGSLLAVGILVLVIWLLSGAHADLSILWVAAALAVLVVARRVMGGRGRGQGRSARRTRSRAHRGGREDGR